MLATPRMRAGAAVIRRALRPGLVVSPSWKHSPSHGSRTAASSQTCCYVTAAAPTEKRAQRANLQCDVMLWDGEKMVWSPPRDREKPRAAAGRVSDSKSVSSVRSFFTNGYKFLYSAELMDQHRRNDDVPEIVILGASNVGKSSFINGLVNEKGAAKVSHRPGKTTMMNAFGIGPPLKKSPFPLPRGSISNHSLVLMDTPGYGFKSQASWGDAIVDYLGNRTMLRGAILLLSADKDRVLEQDRWAMRALAESNTPTTVVLTKADKASNNQFQKCADMAALVQAELRTLSARVNNGWRAGAGYTPDIYITAASIDGKSKSHASNSGLHGARSIILEMAGYNHTGKSVTKKEENMEYSGKIVSFDDIAQMG